MCKGDYAQCPTTDPGGVCAATYTGISSVVLPSGTFPFYDVCVSGTLTLDEDFYIAPSTVVRMEPDAKIIVQDGVLLVIDDNVQIFGKTEMWDYIQVDGGGQIQCTGASIRDDEIGIKAMNGTEESVMKINNTTFCNNEMGIYFGPISINDVLGSTVTSCTFSAPGMKAPLAGQQGDYGIFVDKVESIYPGGCIIGDNLPFSSSTTFNSFENLSIGVRTYRSDVVINDCKFNNIFTVSGSDMPDGFPIIESFSGMAICATSELNYPRKLVVGTTMSGGTTVNNQITNTKYGIYCDTYMSSEISYNTIDGDLVGGEYNLLNGIDLENINSHHLVQHNTITDFSSIGILIRNLTGTSIADIRYNTINTTLLLSDIVPEMGIRVDMSAITTTLNTDIRNNDIDKVKTGIWVRNVEGVLVSDNKVDFTFPTGSDPLVPAHGIYLEKCDDAQILYNKCLGSCTSGCNQRVRPFYLQSCLNFLADHNYAGGANRYSILLDLPCTDGNMTCNEIHNSNWGIGLRQLGVDGVGPIEATGGLPSDNSFYLNNADDSRVHCFGPTPGTTWSLPVTWIYQAIPYEFDLPYVTTTFVLPSEEVIPTINEVSSECYSGLKLTEEAIYEIFSNKYTGWAENYLENGYGESVNNYYKAWNFYKSVTEDTTIQKYISGELSEVYNLLAENNIGKFYSVLNVMSKAEYDSATSINNTIDPENTIEEYWQQTNDIYLNSIYENGNLIISDENFIALKGIALLDGGENGFGVYNARGMTGTEAYNFEEETEDEKSINSISSIRLYPNPAENVIYITNIKSQEKETQILLIDISGAELLNTPTEDEIYTLDISSIKPGVYILKILQSTKTILNEKLIIIK